MHHIVRWVIEVKPPLVEKRSPCSLDSDLVDSWSFHSTTAVLSSVFLWDAILRLRSQFPVASPNMPFCTAWLASIGLSNFLLAFLKSFFVFLVISGSNKVISSQSSMHCRVLASRFSILDFISSERLSYFWVIHDRATYCFVLWLHALLSVSLLDHIYPLGGFSFNKVNFVKPFHESDKVSVRIDTPTIINTNSACNTSRSV